MEQIKLAVMAGQDVTEWKDPKFSWEHMEAIRHLQKEGYNIKPMLNPELTAEEYSKIALEIELDTENIVIE